MPDENSLKKAVISQRVARFRFYTAETGMCSAEFENKDKFTYWDMTFIYLAERQNNNGTR